MSCEPLANAQAEIKARLEASTAAALPRQQTPLQNRAASSGGGTAGNGNSSPGVQRSPAAVAMAEAAAAAAAAGRSPLADRPSGGGAAATDADATLAAAAARQSAQLRQLAGMLSGLDGHLTDHTELAKALMTGTQGQERAPKQQPLQGLQEAVPRRQLGDHSTAAAPSTGIGAGSGAQQQQQVLHPHQVDGAELRAIAARAAAGLLGTSTSTITSTTIGSAGAEQQPTPPAGSRPSAVSPPGPDQIVLAVQLFASMLGSLAPHVSQLAMAGEAAGERGQGRGGAGRRGAGREGGEGRRGRGAGTGWGEGRERRRRLCTGMERGVPVWLILDQCALSRVTRQPLNQSTFPPLAIRSCHHAGPPPLLQPPSQPSSHAAHVAHQLQVRMFVCVSTW